MRSPNTVEITDIYQFMHILNSWHKEQIMTLEHFKNIPEGSEIEVNNVDFQTLSGATLTGFVLGIELAISLFGQLPFVGETPEGAFIDLDQTND